MGTDHFGESIAHARHPLVRVQSLRCATSLEPPGVEDKSSFARSKVTKRRDLLHLATNVAKQSRVLITDCVRVYFGRILEHIGETYKRIRHHGLICHRWTEHMRDRARPRIRLILSR